MGSKTGLMPPRSASQITKPNKKDAQLRELLKDAGIKRFGEDLKDAGKKVVGDAMKQ